MNIIKLIIIKNDEIVRRVQFKANLAIRFALVGCVAIAVHIYVL